MRCLAQDCSKEAEHWSNYCSEHRPEFIETELRAGRYYDDGWADGPKPGQGSAEPPPDEPPRGKGKG